MSDDPLERLAAQLREDLRASVSAAPPVTTLRRRRTTRAVGSTLGALGIVVAALVAAPQMLGAPDEPGLEVASPPGDSAPDMGQGRAGVAPIDVPEPIPARVLAVEPNGPRLALIDLDRGEIVRYRSSRLSGDAISGATLTADGTVVVWQNGEVRAFTKGPDQRPLVHRPDDLINPPHAAPSVRVLPTGDETGLWVVQIGHHEDAGLVELVDLDTGDVRATAEVPARAMPIATTTRGLLLNTSRPVETTDGWVAEPGSHRVLQLDEEGSLTQISTGEAFAAAADTAAILTCEDHRSGHGCDIALVDTSTGQRRQIEAPPGSSWAGVTQPNVPTDTPPWPATAPDGRILAAAGSQLMAIDPDRAETSSLDDHGDPLPPAAWDRSGEHLVLVDGDHLTIFDPDDGARTELRDVIPPNHHVVAIR